MYSLIVYKNFSLFFFRQLFSIVYFLVLIFFVNNQNVCVIFRQFYSRLLFIYCEMYVIYCSAQLSLIPHMDSACKSNKEVTVFVFKVQIAEITAFYAINTNDI